MKKIRSHKEDMPNASYTILGRHDYLDGDGLPVICDTDEEHAEDRPEAYAKVMSNRFFVKANARGELYNPIGLYSENTQNSNRKGTGTKIWQYKETHYKAFMTYLNFLKTKNVAYLLNAERETQ